MDALLCSSRFSFLVFLLKSIRASNTEEDRWFVRIVTMKNSSCNKSHPCRRRWEMSVQQPPKPVECDAEIEWKIFTVSSKERKKNRCIIVATQRWSERTWMKCVAELSCVAALKYFLIFMLEVKGNFSSQKRVSKSNSKLEFSLSTSRSAAAAALLAFDCVAAPFIDFIVSP